MKEFFKNLGRYKVSSTLNILGLGIAFAAAYAILVPKAKTATCVII